jgi:hypothetical protein
VRPLRDIEDSFFEQFNVILLSSDSDQLLLKYHHFQCDKEALRINKVCREQSPQISFFWSGSFCLEGWFLSDLGTSFQFTKDPPNNREVQTMSFPSLEEVLQKRWCELQSRHFPIPKTFIQSRILNSFKAKRGMAPGQADLIELQQLAAHMLEENNLGNIYIYTSSSYLPNSTTHCISCRPFERSFVGPLHRFYRFADHDIFRSRRILSAGST